MLFTAPPPPPPPSNVTTTETQSVTSSSFSFIRGGTSTKMLLTRNNSSNVIASTTVTNTNKNNNNNINSSSSSSSTTSSNSSRIGINNNSTSNGTIAMLQDESLPPSGAGMMPFLSDPTTGAALRFEDLTIDDDLSFFDRVVRYVRSGIALQRLVHVKILAETARSVGSQTTLRSLIPLLPPLVSDSESIIRLNLATQLVFLALTCMFHDDSHFMMHMNSNSTKSLATTTAATSTSMITSKPLQFLPTSHRTYNEQGYKVVTTAILSYYSSLLIDPDLDVRKAASDGLVSLALHIRSDDIAKLILPIPIRFLQQSNTQTNGSKQQQQQQQGNGDGTTNNNNNKAEDVKITCINLLADLASLITFSSSISPRGQCISPLIVARLITPTILSLVHSPSHVANSSSGNSGNNNDPPSSFRIRRSIVQAIPRIIAGSAADDVHRHLIPAFVRLSEDDMYRVRKSVGECLVDMSRSFMILAENYWIMTTTMIPSNSGHHLNTVKGRGGSGSSGQIVRGEEQQELNEFSNMSRDDFRQSIMDIRRKTLIGICCRLLKDSNKFVRHGMMQFLGPFLASFYPLDGSEGSREDSDGIVQILGSYTESSSDSNSNASTANGSNNTGAYICGLGVQFFPHVNGMVNRLNPSLSVTPAMVLNPSLYGGGISCFGTSSPLSKSTSTKKEQDNEESLRSKLPYFVEKFHADALVLNKILHHRDMNPPSPQDVSAISEKLLRHYVELATIRTGDENTDAEMRVYCAYSFPAVVLLMGKDGWKSALRECFLALVIGSTNLDVIASVTAGTNAGQANPVPPPVKRCLAASFHSVCHILGSQVVTKHFPSEKGVESNIDLLTVFEVCFFRDSDETTTLNIIRNLPSLLSLLSPSKRSSLLPVLHEIVTGDSILGVVVKKRSALNPFQLNWRQRDMVAQILPNLIMLYRPYQVRCYIWPIVKILLSDPVNIVREHAEWSVPILFRNYEINNCNFVHDDEHGAFPKDTSSKDDSVMDGSKFSADACSEVLSYLKVTLLDNHTGSSKRGTTSYGGAFGKRQGYCRIVMAVALLLRMRRFEKRKSLVRKGKATSHPFYNLNSDEYRHVHHILLNYLLPAALNMKDDKVTNVRLGLLKCLRVMPSDIRDQELVKNTLSRLEEEVQTWDGDCDIAPADQTYVNRNDPNAVKSTSSVIMQPSGSSQQNSSNGQKNLVAPNFASRDRERSVAEVETRSRTSIASKSYYQSSTKLKAPERVGKEKSNQIATHAQVSKVKASNGGLAKREEDSFSLASF